MKKKSLYIVLTTSMIVVFSVCFWLAYTPGENDLLISDERANKSNEQSRIIAGLDEPLPESEGDTAMTRVAMSPETPSQEIEPEKTFFISGTVIEDGSGKPIPEFEIVVVHSDFDYKKNEGFPPVRKEFKDEAGRFSLGLDFGGNMRVHVDSTGYYQEGWLVQTLSKDAATADVILKLKKSLSIKGKTVDESSGTPVAGVEIKHGYPGIRRRDAEGNISESVDLFRSSTLSNAQGEFEIGPLRDGMYIVTTNHEEYAQQSVDAMAGSEGIVIRLNRGDRAGRIHGTVRNDEGVLVEGVEVRYKGDDGTQGGPYLSDKHGYYITDPIRPGKVRIWAKASVQRNGQPIPFTEEGYRLNFEGGEVKVDFGPSMDHVTWKGIFFGWDGNPVASGRLRVWNDRIDDIHIDKRIDSGPSIHRTITCGEDGSFEILKLVPGTFKVDLLLPGAMLLVHKGELDEVTFERPGSHEMDITYRRTEISGVVLDGESMEPVKAGYGFVSASALGGGGYYSDNIDGKSRFCFRGLPPGKYQLTVSCEGKASLNYGAVSIEDNQILDNIEMVLPVNGQLKVTVKGLKEATNTIIRLSISRSDGTPVWTVGPGRYNSNQTWELDIPHETGSWILELSDATLGKAVRNYEIHQRETTELNFDIEDFKME